MTGVRGCEFVLVESCQVWLREGASNCRLLMDDLCQLAGKFTRDTTFGVDEMSLGNSVGFVIAII